MRSPASLQLAAPVLSTRSARRKEHAWAERRRAFIVSTCLGEWHKSLLLCVYR